MWKIALNWHTLPYLVTLQVKKTAKKGLKNDFFSNVLTKITVLHFALSGQQRK